VSFGHSAELVLLLASLRLVFSLHRESLVAFSCEAKSREEKNQEKPMGLGYQKVGNIHRGGQGFFLNLGLSRFCSATLKQLLGF